LKTAKHKNLSASFLNMEDILAFSELIKLTHVHDQIFIKIWKIFLLQFLVKVAKLT